MKKMQFVLVSLALLAMLTSVAAAPLAISLIQVRNDAGGSVVFVFKVSGQFSSAQLKGTVHVNGDDLNFPLNCVQKDETTVQCTTSKNAGGKNVVVTFGGSKFWTDVPEAAAPQSQFCNNIYVWAPPEGDGFSWVLVTLTRHCQNTPANYGDILLNVYSPYWDSYDDYEFLPSCDYQTADGYYVCKK